CEFLKGLGLEIDDDVQFKSIQENFLFYNVVSRTKDRLILSYPIMDIEGMSLRPSIFLSQLKEIYPDLKEDNDRPFAENLISNSKGTIKYLINFYRDAVEGKVEPSEDIWNNVYKWYASHPQWRPH